MFYCVLNASGDRAVGAEVPCYTAGILIPSKGTLVGKGEFSLMSANVPCCLSAYEGIWRQLLVRCIKVCFVYFKCPKCKSFQVSFFWSDIYLYEHQTNIAGIPEPCSGSILCLPS